MHQDGLGAYSNRDCSLVSAQVFLVQCGRNEQQESAFLEGSGMVDVKAQSSQFQKRTATTIDLPRVVYGR